MLPSERLITAVSRKGEIILPEAIRRALRWEGGARPVIENAPMGVPPKPEREFVETRPEDVFGCLACDGSSRPLAAMQAGVLAEARRRNAGG